MTVVFTVQFILLAGGLLWKGSQVARRPRDLPLWAVVGTLAAGLIGWFITTYAGGRTSQPSITPSTQMFWLGRVFNPFLMVFGIAVFYILASNTRVKPRLLTHTAFLLAALTLGTVLALTAPPGPAPNHTYPIYLTSFTYAGTTMFVVVVMLTRRYAQAAAPRLRHGLYIAGIGAGLISAACLVQVVLFLLRWLKVFTLPASASGVLGLLPLIGGLIFVIGLLYPATMMRAAAVRAWYQHGRDYRRLAPLSDALYAAYPELALSRVPSAAPAPQTDETPSAHRVADTGWSRVSPFGINRRRYRRIIEIRDALVKISPYLGDNPPTDPTALAERLRDALARRSRGEEPHNETVSPLALPDQGGTRAEVDALLALSDAMARTAPKGDR
ncbi:hypothetical protein SAMN04489732_1296 [Amycolatopsis saalfeldensis]|uniref:DUF6545 domain-containing protein n=1 Tax=Amycolatopsis saalfeldensis TaxID=394193 RepID=A0A1H8YNK1_9PSEU|nr:hypothetical protein SAMN04489732_1296 [Amycolatopsis saalfeldensis]